jgi:hypothetical protein
VARLCAEPNLLHTQLARASIKQLSMGSSVLCAVVLGAFAHAQATPATLHGLPSLRRCILLSVAGLSYGLLPLVAQRRLCSQKQRPSLGLCTSLYLHCPFMPFTGLACCAGFLAKHTSTRQHVYAACVYAPPLLCCCCTCALLFVVCWPVQS